MKNIAISLATETVAKTTILDTELSVSKPRGRCPRCILCGKAEDAGYPGGKGRFIRTFTPHESVTYIHAGCCSWREYGQGDGLLTDYSGQPIPRAHGKAVGRGLTFTPELECFGPETWPKEKMAQFCATYRVQPSRDCTVGCEFHPTTAVNFHGFRQALLGMSESVDFTNSRCGFHLNFGWDGLDRDELGYLKAMARQSPFRPNSTPLFALVEREMELDGPDVQRRVWGRPFHPDWASNNREYVHGCWVNLDSWEHPRIEFRLPHMESVQQISWTAYMCAEMAEALRDFSRNGVNREQTAKRLLRAYTKNRDGRATYQRPERNKG